MTSERTTTFPNGSPTRRGFLSNAAVGVAAGGTALALAIQPAPSAANAPRTLSASPGPSAPLTRDDAELVALAERMVALQKRREETGAVCSMLYKEYEALAPERPEVLRWRFDDPVGPLESPDVRRWCDPFWSQRLRGVEQRRYWFVGTEEEGATIKGTEFSWSGRPDASIAHLYRSEPDPRKQRRADEILAANDAFEAADKAALTAVGYDAASDAHSAITDEMEEVFERMAKLEPSTLEGFRSLATGFVCNYWNGEIESSSYGEEMMIAKIMSGLTGMHALVASSNSSLTGA
jgi:hypothetical protein